MKDKFTAMCRVSWSSLFFITVQQLELQTASILEDVDPSSASYLQTLWNTTKAAVSLPGIETNSLLSSDNPFPHMNYWKVSKLFRLQLQNFFKVKCWLTSGQVVALPIKRLFACFSSLLLLFLRKALICFFQRELFDKHSVLLVARRWKSLCRR